jgi:Skp family chaperone for outer membrane proteins
MKNKIIYSLLFLAFFSTFADATEIAVVNVEEIVKNSKVIANVQKTLEDKKNELEKKLKVDEKKLTDEKNELEGQLKILSQDVAQEKVAKFQEKVVSFQTKVKENEVLLQKGYVNAINDITKKIKEIVVEIKNEKDGKYKFDMVVLSNAVVYSDSSFDISSEVLVRLNKKLKKVNVNFK